MKQDKYKELIEIYISNIESFIEAVKRKIVIFDLDGTLTALKYSQNGILPCADDELEEYHRTHNMYLQARALKTMQYIISQLAGNDMYVLTKSVSTTIDKKTEYIKKNFPQIRDGNIYHVLDVESKLSVLIDIHAKTGKEIIFVEDTADTILHAEENLDYVKGFHVSSMIA